MRPPIWDDPEAFSKKVDEYFDNTPKDEQGWVDLALYLGFAGRDSLNDYLKKPEFFHPIKKALSKVEREYEKGLKGRNPAGSIFALKNFGWKDKQEVEQSGGTSITVKWDQNLIPTSHTESPPQE
jgi:hypothetical protein